MCILPLLFCRAWQKNHYPQKMCVGFYPLGARMPLHFFNNKIWLCGDSLAITFPRQVARMHDIQRGDYMEISPIGIGGIQDNEGGWIERR